MAAVGSTARLLARSPRPSSLLYSQCPIFSSRPLTYRSLATASTSNAKSSFNPLPTPPHCHLPLSSSPSPSPLCRYHLLLYTYVDNMIERRTPVRPLHLAHATPYVERQQLLLGGACPPEVKDAVLVFHATKEEVEEFAQKDPYVLNQLVEDWKVKEWTVVLGSAMKK